MRRFSFQAIDGAGARQSGELEALSQVDALSKIESQGWTALRIAEPRAVWTQLWRRPMGRAGIRTRELVEFTQALAALLAGGLTIDRALAVHASTTERARERSLVTRLLNKVKEGGTFADALDAEPGVPNYYTCMIRAGELGGALPPVMARTATFLHRAQDLRDRIHSALIYPLILLGMIALTLVLVLFVVLPRFERLFAEAGATLPLATRLVLNLGHFVANYGSWLLVLTCGVFLIARRWWRSPGAKRRVHRWLLKLWVVGPLTRRLETARFLRTLATLLANGESLPAGIRVARGTLNNLAFTEATDHVLQRLREGESLADRLAQAEWYPRVAVQLARVGEESGRLEHMLGEAAEILDREAQQTLERSVAVLVPAVTIAMGALVAAIVASVLVGILSLNDLAL